MKLQPTPIFGYGGEERPQKGRVTIKRDQGGHETWADAILPADAEAGAIETTTSRRPLVAIAVAIIATVGLLTAQLIHLQIVGGQHNLGLADGNRLREKITRAPRGIIYDRHGVILAQNQANFDISVIPSLLPKRAEDRGVEYGRVASLLHLSTDDIAAKAERDCVAAERKRKVAADVAEHDCLTRAQPQLVATNIDRDTALNLDQNTATVPGFSLDVNPTREYTDPSFSALLGYTGRVSEEDVAADRTYGSTDYIGKAGVENSYENQLRGQNGSEQTEVDASGQPIKLLASKPAVAGNNLTLSIDKDMQDKLTAVIQQQLDAAHTQKGAGVVLNAKTGEVLASVSLPGYDNNLFAKGISQTDYSKLSANPAQPLFNKAINGAFATGSIIKPLVASAALQERVVTPTTTIEDKGKIEIPNPYNPAVTYTFNGWEHSGLGQMNVFRAIALSSDIYFYTIAGGFEHFVGLGVNKLTHYYNLFGLGSHTKIDLPNDAVGRVPTPDWKKKVIGEQWYTGDTYNISVGQGDILASPLQMALATATVANGGNLLQPHVVQKVTDEGGATVQENKTQIVRSGFIDPANLDIVRQGMRQTVQSGTACCFIDKQVPVQVAGKTGSAETDPGTNRPPHSWFTAFAPYNDPQIVTVVLLENAGEGAEYAAPATREFMAWCFTRPGGCLQ